MADHWLIWIIVSAMPIAALLFHLWEGIIRPRLIPTAKIEAMAADMIEVYDDLAPLIAEIEVDRARRYSKPFDEGVWKRVERVLLGHYALRGRSRQR